MEYTSDDAASPGVDLPALFDDLVRLETALWDQVDRELRATHGLPLSWFEPMEVVQRTDGCRVVDIAEALSITVGGTSKLVDRITAAGLLVRAPHPSDGRSSTIALSSAGEQVLERARRTFDAALEVRMAGAISPTDLALFARTLRQLRVSLHGRARSA